MLMRNSLCGRNLPPDPKTLVCGKFFEWHEEIIRKLSPLILPGDTFLCDWLHVAHLLVGDQPQACMIAPHRAERLPDRLAGLLPTQLVRRVEDLCRLLVLAHDPLHPHAPVPFRIGCVPVL